MRRTPRALDGCLTEPRLLILVALGKKARHGYGIIQDVKGLGNSEIRLTTATVYGCLRELTELGLIENKPADGNGRKKRFSKEYVLTAAGRKSVHQHVTRMRWLLDVVEKQGF